jgi:rod shape-determining protein MreC
LNTADRAKALELFQQQTKSKTIAASVFSMGIGSSRKVVWVDRGSLAGVMREMAVLIPDGIVGKVTDVYPTASEVLLITDPTFSAGVVTGKTHVHGLLKGTGTPLGRVDFVAFEDKVEPGDWFYTSGDDRIFPRGLPVGVVKSVHPAVPYKEITLDPSGMSHGGLEDVLIVVEGVHQEIPDTPPPNQQVYLGPPPPATTVPGALTNPDGTPVPDAAHPTPGTEADRLHTLYQKSAESSGVTLGGGPTGLTWTPKPPDFTKLPVDPRSANPGRGTPGAAPLARKSTAPTLETKGTGSEELKPDAVRHANQAAGPGGGHNRP